MKMNSAKLVLTKKLMRERHSLKETNKNYTDSSSLFKVTVNRRYTFYFAYTKVLKMYTQIYIQIKKKKGLYYGGGGGH